MQHQGLLLVEGHHRPVRQAVRRVHKVVQIVRELIDQHQIVRVRLLLAAEDPIALVQLVQERVVKVQSHRGRLWAARTIRRVFVRELLSR